MNIREKRYIYSQPKGKKAFEFFGCRLHIIGQEFGEQSRTVRFRYKDKKWNKYLKFPVTHFCKYHFAGPGLPNDMFCYTINGYVNDRLLTINLPDIKWSNGMVGMGEMAGGDYLTTVDIDFDDFINNFWLTYFTGEHYEEGAVCNDRELCLEYPHLWAKEPFINGWTYE